MVDHIDSTNTTRIEGTYRGEPAVHYLDREYGLDVVTTPDGGFWVAGQLGPAQIENVVERESDLTDLEARRVMASAVVDWLEGHVRTEEFIRGYWQTRRELLSTNWNAFEGPFGEVMSSVDTAVDSYRAEDRAQFEIDEQQLNRELRAAIDRLRDLTPEVLAPEH